MKLFFLSAYSSKLPKKTFFPFKKIFPLFPLLLLLAVCFSPFFHLHALEIRLYPPEKIYIANDHLYINTTTSENLLDEPSLKNFNYNMPFTITYYIELHKKKWFFSQKIRDVEIIKHVRQDLWSSNYFVAEKTEQKRFKNYNKLHDELTQLTNIQIIEKDKLATEEIYFIKTRIAIKIRNFASFYYLINNLVSLFEYRTTYLTSKEYRGKVLLGSSRSAPIITEK